MKSYYLVFGASRKSASEVANFIQSKLDAAFQQIGHFFRTWFYFAQIYVADNFSEVERKWLEFEDQEFEVIVYVQIAHGKSEDRISMHKWLKGWLSQHDKLTLLYEEVLEENE